MHIHGLQPCLRQPAELVEQVRGLVDRIRVFQRVMIPPFGAK